MYIVAAGVGVLRKTPCGSSPRQLGRPCWSKKALSRRGTCQLFDMLARKTWLDMASAQVCSCFASSNGSFRFTSMLFKGVDRAQVVVRRTPKADQKLGGALSLAVVEDDDFAMDQVVKQHLGCFSWG